MLIVGVPLNALYETEIRLDQKIKYNEDTGKPYLVEVNRLYASFGNKLLPPVDEVKKDFPQNWEFLENTGLQLYMPCYPTNYSLMLKNGIIGISDDKICSDEYDDRKYDQCFSIAELIKTAKKVEFRIAANFGVVVEAKVFSQLIAE